MITVIPKKTITRMKMLYDPKGRTMEQWHRDYGFDYGINTVLFELEADKNGNYALCGILDIDGKRLRDVALDYGFGIKNNSLVFSYDNLAKCPDFAAFAYSVLVRDGEIEVTQAESGKRGLQWRSAVGINKAGDIILFCQHANRSLMGIAGDMQAAGCTVAGNYDGGGSSNLWTPSAQLLTTRPLPAILAIWTGEQEDKPTNDDTKEENDMLRVLLIAGHGDGDPGAVANGIEEADETRAIVSNLDTQLEGICQVDIYPTERNAYKDLKAGKLAVKWNDYDYVLEIHLNACEADTPDGETKGVECYVTRSEPGTSVEEAICKNIASLGLANRGVKRKNLDVIQAARTAGVSSALLEVCFLDDPDDMEIYQANKTAIATAIAAGIVSGFGLQAKPEQPQPWYQEAMEWVMAEGISNGDRPTDAATRADVWAMLLRLFRVLGGV